MNSIKSSVVKKWLKGEISLKSLILHSTGSIFIGTPDSFDMPEDFYYVEGDRNFPHPNEYDWHTQRALLYVDNFRRALTVKVCNLCVIVALMFFGGGLLFQGFAGGVRVAASQVQKTFNSIFKNDSSTSSDIENRDDAIERLKDLRQSFEELTNEPPSESRDQKMMEINSEADRIFSAYPDLRKYILE